MSAVGGIIHAKGMRGMFTIDYLTVGRWLAKNQFRSTHSAGLPSTHGTGKSLIPLEAISSGRSKRLGAQVRNTR